MSFSFCSLKNNSLLKADGSVRREVVLLTGDISAQRSATCGTCFSDRLTSLSVTLSRATLCTARAQAAVREGLGWGRGCEEGGKGGSTGGCL